jgi:hypothetical protein
MRIKEMARRLAAIDAQACALDALAEAGEVLADAVRVQLGGTPSGMQRNPRGRDNVQNAGIEVVLGEGEAVVGSKLQVVATQERGTASVPPQPVLAPTAAGMGGAIAAMVGAKVSVALRKSLDETHHNLKADRDERAQPVR